MNNYIWHCPTEQCKERGIILFKTNTLLLDGEIKCQICGKIYTFEEILKSNPNNIKRYIKNLNKSKVYE